MDPIQPLERPLYFAGKLLSVEDLRQDQEYVLGRFRRLNRYGRGWGIVTGLGVSVDGSTINVAPGLAIDCAGNEIVLASPQALLIEGNAPRGYVVIRFAEAFVGPVPIGDGDPQFSRVRESAAVEVVSTNPNTGHRGMGPRTPGCGDAHGLSIATLSRRGDRWHSVRQIGLCLAR